MFEKMTAKTCPNVRETKLTFKINEPQEQEI